MNDDPSMSEVPTPDYLIILLHSGPLGILLHLLTFLSVFVFLWLVWKKAAPTRLFLVAVLPLSFAATLMHIGVQTMIVLSEGYPNAALDFYVAKGIIRVYQINASITAGLCLIALAVVLARRLKARP